ncbi:hypothetical protein Tco_0742490 [Tanacetum coccineum]
MALSIADQIALDDALVAPADRLKIGKYAPEIYMQEFWASAYVHNRSFLFKMNNKKHIIVFGTPSYDSLRLSQAQLLWGMYNKKNVDYAYLLWEDFIFKIEKQKLRKLTMFTTINVISRNETTQLYGAILPVALTNEDIRNSESYKEYYARASGTIPPKTKGSKQKANTDIITQQKPPTAPKKKKLRKLGVTPGVPDVPDYDSEDDISWKSSDDDQDDEQDQDDEDAEKHDVHETTQEDEDDDDHDDDENAQKDDNEYDDDKKADDDDDEELTKSDDDGDEFVHPKLTTLYEKDQGNEAVKDTNTDLDGRDKVMIDVEDTHVTPTPVNPDGQQQSSSVSSGFVSNMLNPNQDTGVDDIFRQHTEATSLIDTSVTAIMEPSFTAQCDHQRNQTSHAVAANLSELELKKILIDKMEANNSINRSDIQEDSLYKMMIKNPQLDRPGVNRKGHGKEPASTCAPKELCQSTMSFKGPAFQEFENRFLSKNEQAGRRGPTSSDVDPRESFDELTDSTFDFSAFVLNRLNVQTLTPELLAGLTFELIKGTCKSLTELEYFCKEVYKEQPRKLDWINPEGRQYSMICFYATAIPLVQIL